MNLRSTLAVTALLSIAAFAAPAAAQAPPVQCFCPQPQGTTRPAQCLPCGSPITTPGSCGPAVQTAPTCAPPLVCNCQDPDATSYPAACGCPATLDLVAHGAAMLGIDPNGATMESVLAASRPIDAQAIAAAIQAAQVRVANGGGLANDPPGAPHASFAAAIAGLAAAPLHVGSSYSNQPVLDQGCETDEDGIGCFGRPIFTSFIINVHDFVNYDQSFTQVSDIISWHTAYDLPVFLYIDDQVLQAWVDAYGEADVVALLASRPDLVSAAYHTRAPFPYENGSYWGDWTSILTGTTGYFDNATRTRSQQAFVAAFYEALGVDTTDGLPSSHPGGYAYLKSLVGYAPAVVTNSFDNNPRSKALSDVYTTLGASLTVRHGELIDDVRDICTKNHAGNLYTRPDSVNIKVYEQTTAKTGTELFGKLVRDRCENWENLEPADFDNPGSPLWTKVTATVSGRMFLNFKWHDNNFYMNKTPWLRIYANHESADAMGTPACETAPDVGGDGIRDDWNGDGVKDVDDIAIAPADNEACGLYHDNTRWDTSRGITKAGAEMACVNYNMIAIGNGCGMADFCSCFSGLNRQWCEGYCGYVKTSSQRNALDTNYGELLAYVSSNARFRVIGGDDLVNIAHDTTICP